MHDNMSKVYKKDKFHKNKVGKYKTANRRIKYHKSGGHGIAKQTTRTFSR